MNKYTNRKLLVIFIVILVAFGPILIIRTVNFINPSLEILTARAIEAQEKNIDVVNVRPDLADETRLVIIVQLDNQSYWSQPRRWDNMLKFMLSLTNNMDDYDKLMVLISWEEGIVIAATRCDTLRFVDCVTRVVTPFTLKNDFYPWVGKGKP